MTVVAPNEIYKVVNVETGHTYRIFADGRAEGFPDGCFVVNRIPQHVWHAVRTTVEEQRATE